MRDDLGELIIAAAGVIGVSLILILGLLDAARHIEAKHAKVTTDCGIPDQRSEPWIGTQ